MKKLKTMLTLSMIAITSIILTACGANASEVLAKNLDNSVTNFVYTVSSMDWVETETINNLNPEATQTSSSNNYNSNNTSSINNFTNNYSTQNRTSNNQTGTNIVKSNMNTNVRLSPSNTNVKINNVNSTTNNGTSNNDFMVSYDTENLLNRIDDIQAQINSLVSERATLMLYIKQF